LIKTLDDLYKYTNEKLLQGELDGIDDVIDYFDECQQLIAGKFPIEAPKITVTLTTNEIAMPSDFQELRKIVINSTEVNPTDIWGETIDLPKEYTSGEATLYYYKKPNELDKSNLNQVLDIDSRYIPLIGKYAAQMYYLTDDDPEMREAYRTSFIESLSEIGNINKNKKRSNYKNVW
jgi:hypothetical protein